MIQQIVFAQLLWPRIRRGEPFFKGWGIAEISAGTDGRIVIRYQNEISGKKGSLVLLLKKKYKNYSGMQLPQSKNFYFVSDGGLFPRTSGRSVRPDRFLVSVIKKNDTKDFLFLEDDAYYQKHPLGIVMAVTHKCNLSCFFCFNSHDYNLKSRNTLKDLDTRQLCAAIDRLYSAGIRMVIVAGGEPLLRKDIVGVLRYLHKKKMFVILNTNGTTADKKLLSALLRLPIYYQISMHSFSDKGEGVFSGDAKGFSKKKHFIAAVRSRAVGFDILTALTPDNIAGLHTIYTRVVKGIRPDHWQFFRLLTTAYSKGWRSSDAVRAIRTVDALNAAHHTSFQIVDSVPYCVTKDITKAKRVVSGEMQKGHMVKLIMDARGNIQLMCMFQRNIGNIFRTSLRTLYRSKLVRDVLSFRRVPQACRKCPHLRLCCGGSRFEAIAVNGSVFGEDPLMNKYNLS
jgi:radical SAM protein with 4Fe4S-binding SPASM domain